MLHKIILLTIGILITGIYILSYSSSAPESPGALEGQLSPCPDSPNCVSSQSEDAGHAISAINAHGDRKTVMRLLADIINKEGGRIVRIDGPYLHAVFRSTVFRFPDDLECYYDRSSGRIKVRSAARLGYSDFSVNRKRVERLRSLFEAAQRSR